MNDEQEPKPGPRVGHFLPGGDGDQPAAPAGGTPRTALTPPDAVNRRQLGLGKARPLDAPVDPALKKAAPLPTDPTQQGFGAPPVAPLAGAPVTPLRGGRQLGGARPVGWHTTSTRTGVPQFASEPPELKSPRRFSRPIVGLLSALALIAVSGGAVASYRLIDSFDSTVANPLTQPTVKPSETPLPAPAVPTKTVTVEPIPDIDRLQKNELYKAGKLATVNCAVPKVKPNTKANQLRFYQAMMPCLAETWEPLVLKAKYPFRQPKLALAAKSTASSCVGESDVSYYCGSDETITMQWEEEIKQYKRNPEFAVVSMMNTMAHEYGHHVQALTEILTAAWSREGYSKTKDEKLAWTRRKELQASCLGATFIGANKATLLRGDSLRIWELIEKNSGDEYNPKKIRDHGSKKSQWLWAGPAFKSTNPASCNTFTAPSAKVS
ncbi:neutral zinc metallopeptidase [Kribbella sp. NPDC056861]|uniref:neutral zinc metallopeptidase n=1 Tax=Kribbella sp. NPDC056861 TaxID=3154857 RepID=UPI00343195F1